MTTLFLIVVLFLRFFSEAAAPERKLPHLGLGPLLDEPEWNPPKDAIYDEINDLCFFESSPHLKFHPSDLSFKTNFFQSGPYTTTSQVLGSPGSIDLFSNTSHEDLYVPVKCKNFDRKWDFCVGTP